MDKPHAFFVHTVLMDCNTGAMLAQEERLKESRFQFYQRALGIAEKQGYQIKQDAIFKQDAPFPLPGWKSLFVTTYWSAKYPISNKVYYYISGREPRFAVTKEEQRDFSLWVQPGDHLVTSGGLPYVTKRLHDLMKKEGVRKYL